MRGHLGNLQMRLQGFGQWHGRLAFQLDHGLAIELRQRQQFIDQRRAIARPYAQGITRCIAEAAAAQVEHQLPGFLACTGPIEQAVFHQGGGPGLLLAIDRDRRRLIDRLWCGSSAQQGQQRFEPAAERFVKVGLAVHPLQQAPPTQLSQALVEFAAKTAELLVT